MMIEREYPEVYFYKIILITYTQELKAQGYSTRGINDKIISNGWRSRNMGVLASLMGYDVIRAIPSPLRADSMVILNRTKLILLGGSE